MMLSRESVLLWNLKRHGAPLAVSGAFGDKLSLERTLAEALLLSRERADVARAWPVAFSRNASRVDFGRLVRFSEEVGQKKTLGFFLELSGRLLGNRQVLRQARKMSVAAKGDPERFSLRDRGARALLLEKKRTPPLAVKWKFWMNASFESFRSCFSRFTVNHAPFY